RPGLAEARYRAVDNARVTLPGLIVGDPQLVQRAHPVVFQDDVKTLDQAEKQLLASGGLEVDFDTLLVPVQADKVGRFSVVKGRSPGTGDVTRAGHFNFDHLGTEIAQHGGAEGASQSMRQIEHFDVFEGQLHGACVSLRRCRQRRPSLTGRLPPRLCRRRVSGGLFRFRPTPSLTGALPLGATDTPLAWN